MLYGGPCEVRWLSFQDHLHNDPKLLKICTAKPTHSHAVFTLWGYISTHLPLSHPFCSHWTNLPRTLPEVASQIVWHIDLHTVAFKAAWWVMQTLEVLADTKSCQTSCLCQDYLVSLVVTVQCIIRLAVAWFGEDGAQVFVSPSPVHMPKVTYNSLVLVPSTKIKCGLLTCRSEQHYRLWRMEELVATRLARWPGFTEWSVAADLLMYWFHLCIIAYNLIWTCGLPYQWFCIVGFVSWDIVYGAFMYSLASLLCWVCIVWFLSIADHRK